MRNWIKLQRALKYATLNFGKNVKLSELAAKTDQSLFHAHRTLRATLGETPKHFTLRLRVDRAAAALISSQASILDIGLACGFESHEAFCRAFRRRFRMSPSAYRKRGLIGPDARAHTDFVDEIGPCVGLYHFDSRERRSQESMEYTISRHQLVAQPVLVVRRRVRRAEIAATIGAELPKVFLHAQQRGLAIAADFFSIEIWTRKGLTRYIVLFLMELSTRRVHIAGIASEATGLWMAPVARNVTDVVDGFLRGKRYLIHDRDPLHMDEFLRILREAGVESVKLPPQSPNLNARAERFVGPFRNPVWSG